MRPSRRAPDELRPVTLERGVVKYAEGSCLAKFGDTHVLCTASIDEKVPPFLRNSGKGWVTAEYGMLPRSTHSRTDREAAKGKQSGRTQEIQRLIGRSLRAVTDLAAMGERQIKIDCDVIQADGGTRTAAITGGYVALALACRYLIKTGKLANLNIFTLGDDHTGGGPAYGTPYPYAEIVDNDLATGRNGRLGGGTNPRYVRGEGCDRHPPRRRADELCQCTGHIGL